MALEDSFPNIKDQLLRAKEFGYTDKELSAAIGQAVRDATQSGWTMEEIQQSLGMVTGPSVGAKATEAVAKAGGQAAGILYAPIAAGFEALMGGLAGKPPLETLQRMGSAASQGVVTGESRLPSQTYEQVTGKPMSGVGGAVVDTASAMMTPPLGLSGAGTRFGRELLTKKTLPMPQKATPSQWIPGRETGTVTAVGPQKMLAPTVQQKVGMVQQYQQPVKGTQVQLSEQLSGNTAESDAKLQDLQNMGKDALESYKGQDVKTIARDLKTKVPSLQNKQAFGIARQIWEANGGSTQTATKVKATLDPTVPLSKTEGVALPGATQEAKVATQKLLGEFDDELRVMESAEQLTTKAPKVAVATPTPTMKASGKESLLEWTAQDTSKLLSESPEGGWYKTFDPTDVDNIVEFHLGVDPRPAIKKAGEVLRSAGRLFGSPYEVAAASPKETQIWEELHRGFVNFNLERNKFLSPAVKHISKVPFGSEQSRQIALALEKKGNLSDPKLVEFKNFIEQSWKETGQRLVDLGVLESKDLVKEGYFHRMWARVSDRTNWEVKMVNYVEDLRKQIVAEELAGKNVAKLREHMSQMEEAVKRVRAGEARVMFDFTPKKVFAPFLLKRKGKEGYLLDASASFFHYMHDFARKVHLEPAAKRAAALINTIDDPVRRTYWKAMIRRYMDLDKREAQFYNKVENVAHWVTNFEWLKDMGFSFRSALTNTTQIINTLTDLGPKGPLYAGKAIESFISNKPIPFSGGKTARQLFAESGHSLDIPWEVERIRAGDPMQGGVSKAAHTVLDYAGRMFNAVERGNRGSAYIAGWFKAIDQGLTHPDQIKAFADSVVKRTQFYYGKTGMSMAQTNPAGRIALQFASYPIKQFELFKAWAREGPSGYAKIVSNILLGELVAEGSAKMLGVDLSNAMGIGLRPKELYNALEAWAKDDNVEASKRVQMFAAPLTGGTGGGIFPSGVAPFLSTAKTAGSGLVQLGEAVLNLNDSIEFGRDVLQSDLYKLVPLQVQRMVDSVRAWNEGHVEDPMTGERGYPMRSNTGELRGLLTGTDLALHSFGPKPVVEKEWQEKRYEQIVEDRTYNRMHKQAVKMIESTNPKVQEKGIELMNRLSADPTRSLETRQMRRDIPIKTRVEYERQMKKSGQVFQTD